MTKKNYKLKLLITCLILSFSRLHNITAATSQNLSYTDTEQEKNTINTTKNDESIQINAELENTLQSTKTINDYANELIEMLCENDGHDNSSNEELILLKFNAIIDCFEKNLNKNKILQNYNTKIADILSTIKSEISNQNLFKDKAIFTRINLNLNMLKKYCDQINDFINKIEKENNIIKNENIQNDINNLNSNLQILKLNETKIQTENTNNQNFIIPNLNTADNDIKNTIFSIQYLYRISENFSMIEDAIQRISATIYKNTQAPKKTLSDKMIVLDNAKYLKFHINNIVLTFSNIKTFENSEIKSKFKAFLDFAKGTANLIPNKISDFDHIKKSDYDDLSSLCYGCSVHAIQVINLCYKQTHIKNYFRENTQELNQDVNTILQKFNKFFFVTSKLLQYLNLNKGLNQNHKENNYQITNLEELWQSLSNYDANEIIKFVNNKKQEIENSIDALESLANAVNDLNKKNLNKNINSMDTFIIYNKIKNFIDSLRNNNYKELVEEANSMHLPCLHLHNPDITPTTEWGVRLFFLMYFIIYGNTLDKLYTICQTYIEAIKQSNSSIK